jgi:hypothetical protein
MFGVRVGGGVMVGMARGFEDADEDAGSDFVSVFGFTFTTISKPIPAVYFFFSAVSTFEFRVDNYHITKLNPG